MVLLNKTDLVSKSHLENLEKSIHQMNPSCKVISCVRSQIDLQQILDLRAFELESAPSAWKNIPSSPLGVQHHPHSGLSNVVLFKQAKAKSSEIITKWLADLLWKNTQEEDLKEDQQIFRMKGVFAVQDSAKKLYLQSVCGLFELDEINEAWSGNEDCFCKVVVIGIQLNNLRLSETFHSLFNSP